MPFRPFIFAFVVFATTCSLSAQSNDFPKVKEVFIPPFPPVVRAVRAEGDVYVAVEVDENGNIVAAVSVSGHPLLRATAKVAAQKWTFSAINGRHFLGLRFMFRLGDYRDKKASRLIGSYTLSIIEPKARIVQTVSYANERNPE